MFFKIKRGKVLEIFIQKEILFSFYFLVLITLLLSFSLTTLFAKNNICRVTLLKQTIHSPSCQQSVVLFKLFSFRDIEQVITKIGKESKIFFCLNYLQEKNFVTSKRKSRFLKTSQKV